MDLDPATITGRNIDGRAGIVEIRGDMSAASEGALMAAYVAACGATTRGVVLNFDKLEFLNSGGIGLLVTLLVRANRQGRRLGACGLSDHYREIFELTRLDEAIAIHSTEIEAIEAVAR